MGRPATGSVKQLKSGTWEARVLDRHGSGKDHYEYFEHLEAAETWRKAALEAVGRGLAVQRPEPVEHWLVELVHFYLALKYKPHGKALPKRANQVRQRLEDKVIPFFAPRWPTPNDVSFDDCVEFTEFLAGHRDINGALLSGTEAAEVLALRETTQTDLLRTLNTLLALGVARGITPINPAESVEAQPRNRRARARRLVSEQRPTGPDGKPVQASLSEVWRVAGRLHILHQVSLFLQRVMGLRVGEVFGILVGDIDDFGDMGVFYVKALGGEKRDQWEDGEPVFRYRVERAKNDSSYRVQIIPPSLMKLIRVVIKVFHTLPDGTVIKDAPLVPGVYKLGAGIGGYRAALTKAGLSEDLVVGTHDLRKFFCVDIAHKTDLNDAVRRLIVGHAAGSDVHGRIYEGHSRDVTAYVNAARQVEEFVRAEVGSLLVPTDSLPRFGTGHPFHARKRQIADALQELGLYGVGREGLTVDEVADQINRAPTTTRCLVERGIIRGGRKVKGNGGAEVWIVPAESVEAYLSTYTGKCTTHELAERFDLTYHQTRRLLQTLEVSGCEDIATRQVLFDEAVAVAAIELELDRVRLLDAESMTIAEAEQVLRKRRSTIASWISAGALRVHPDGLQRDGIRLCRGSVEAKRAELHDRRPGRRLPGR